MIGGLRALAPLLIAALALGGCGGEKKQTQTQTQTQTAAAPTAGGCRQVAAPAARKPAKEKKPTRPLAGSGWTLTFTTNCGAFTVALDQKAAPKASASMVALAKAGFFDHTLFHRIAPGFVIQGGDPSQTGAGGPGYTTVDPPPSSARYTHGVVAMAKTGSEKPGTAGSQFFVVTGADVGLPPDYAVLGRITKGLDVVDRIGRLGDASERPTAAVVIDSVQASQG
jgi:peptidyl-prolyl cis-trans isomerase B (cyclophilin B)